MGTKNIMERLKALEEVPPKCLILYNEDYAEYRLCLSPAEARMEPLRYKGCCVFRVAEVVWLPPKESQHG